MNALDEVRTRFIHQRTRELIEELYEVSLEVSSSTHSEQSWTEGFALKSEQRIVCIPARDEADEIVGTMVMQLLRRAGHDAHSLPIGPVSTMIEEVHQFRAGVVCVSALPPFAAGQASPYVRSCDKHIRQ